MSLPRGEFPSDSKTKLRIGPTIPCSSSAGGKWAIDSMSSGDGFNRTADKARHVFVVL
jgi:hypothetical protein